MIPDFLRDRYDELAARWRERWPEEEPPPFPTGAENPNEVVNLNHVLLARLLGREPIRIVTNTEPLVIREKPETPRGA